MFDVLLQNIRSKIQCTPEEETRVVTFFTERQLRKRQFMLHEGDVCKYTIFVTKGCLRLYALDENEGEHIIQFAPENWWMTDMYSFLSGEPSAYNIDAVEDSQLLIIDRTSQEALFESVPCMEKYFRILLQRNFVASQKRIAESMYSSIEDRYINLQNLHPDIIQRVPQRMIASYLGVTPEFLSKTRSRITHKK